MNNKLVICSLVSYASA